MPFTPLVTAGIETALNTFFEARILHHPFQGFLVRMHTNRFRQVAIAVAIFCHQLAHLRQDMEGVSVVGFAPGIETALNTFLWRDKALKPARQRLLGKVLRVQLQDFATPVVLVFSERQVDVLSAWDGEADCTVITRRPYSAPPADRPALPDHRCE